LLVRRSAILRIDTESKNLDIFGRAREYLPAQAPRCMDTAATQAAWRSWIATLCPWEDVTRMAGTTENPRGGWWKRTAGTGAVVAALLVAQPGAANASAARPPTATQTLSTGAYSWHVAGTAARPESIQNGATNQAEDAGLLHGEFPVVASDGSVQLRRWQWGAVAAFSADTVTVVSDDGYIGDYRIDTAAGAARALDALTVGEIVTVVGTVEQTDDAGADGVLTPGG